MTTSGRSARWRIEDVLDHTDLAVLLDEIAQPGTYSARGRRWHCPLREHDDHHASVTMHTDHRGHERWRCWSGDDSHRGDAIDLVTATQRLSRAEAIEWLAQRAGMIPDQPLPAPARKPRPARPTQIPLDPAVAQYAGACERILWGPAGQPVREWLHGRGFTDELLAANRVGADPGRRMMRRRRGLPYGNSTAAVFPALDPDGEVRYLQARYLDPGDGPKYDNPAAALGSNPRIAWTQTTGPATAGILVACEGIPDALTAAQTGLRSAAILGSQAPDLSVATRLSAFAERHDLVLVAVVDNDPAGRAWGDRLSRLITDVGHELRVIEPPGPDLDLNSWAAQDPAWHACIEGPIGVAEQLPALGHH